VPRAHYCNIKACRTVITTHTVTDTHIHKPRPAFAFLIFAVETFLSFFCAAHLAKTIIISPDSCLRLCAWKLASEKFAAERNYGDVGLHSWRDREINRDERSARLHTRAHTSSTHKALLNFVLMYRLCLTGNDGWDTFLVIFRLLYFITRPIWSRRVIYHSHCMRSACLPYSCFVATCPAALGVLCTGHILQLLMTPLFQFIRRLSGDA
jgi:hypothetical protein